MDPTARPRTLLLAKVLRDTKYFEQLWCQPAGRRELTPNDPAPRRRVRSQWFEQDHSAVAAIASSLKSYVEAGQGTERLPAG
jgi:hypothetical protein